MILFYEGLRPVLAHRVYYFRDKYFAKRELPPPEVPKLDIAKAAGLRPPAASAAPKANPAGSVRPAASSGHTLSKEVPEMQDALARLDELDLNDFSLDFDDVEIPKAQMTDAEIQAAADSFISKLLD